MMFGKRKRDVVSLQVLAGLCIGCARCVDRCRRNVFAMGQMDNRCVAAVVRPEVCVGCGKCLSVCRMEAIELIVGE